MPLNRPETLTSAVITHIRDAIVRGDIPPGSPLPEQALSAELATSRGTVREALRALADTGLVEVFPHRGAFVSELTGHAAWEICSFRALLEPYASRLSVEARQGDPEMVAAVQGAYRALQDAAGQGEMFTIVNADMALHTAILSFCEHRVLEEHLASVQMLTRRLILYTKFYESDLEGEVESHAPIVAAVEAGDADLVESLVRQHVVRAGRGLLNSMADREHDEDRRRLDLALANRWPAIVDRGPDA